MQSLDMAGVPFFIKSVDDAGPLVEAQQLVEDSGVPHTLVYRRTGIRYDTPNYLKPPEEAAKRQHTPKIAFVSPPKTYQASSGKQIEASDVDLLVRALSMGKLHHAMMGTCAVAIGTAAAIPGTLVNLAAGGGEREAVRFGHPSGSLRVGAEAKQVDGQWVVTKAIMSRSARILMEGNVRVPGDAF